jgi:DNA-binding NarL/FixJ family response regulator
MGLLNVMVVEPNPLRRRGIVASILQDPRLNIVGEGEDFIEILRFGFINSSVPDILIINIDHQQMMNMKNWAILRSMLPDIRIVALTEGDDNRILEAALIAGFLSLHPFDVDPDVLCRAIIHASNDEFDFSPILIEKINKILMEFEQERVIHVGEFTINVQKGRADQIGKLECLTEREKDVFKLLGQGMSNRQISQQLIITDSTVSFHVSNIFRKLGIASRTEAALIAFCFQINKPGA